MTAFSLAHARENLSTMIDKVCEDRDPMIITRDGAGEAVVVLPLSEYEAMEETTYLLGSATNAERLRSSIAQLDAGQGSERPIDLGR